MMTVAIKPTDKAVKACYATLHAYACQDVTGDAAVESNFHQLLTDKTRGHGWRPAPRMPVRRAGRSIIPDVATPGSTGPNLIVADSATDLFGLICSSTSATIVYKCSREYAASPKDF